MNLPIRIYKPAIIPSVILLSLFAFLLYYITTYVQRYLSLRQFGGHWSAGWSRIWWFRTQQSGKMHHIFTDINNKYGATARIGPRMLITRDPILMRRMNAVRSPFTRGPWYTALRLHPTRDNVVSHVDEGIHMTLRTKMAPGYSGKENEEMEADVDKVLLRFLKLVESKYTSDGTAGGYRPVDLARVTSFFTLDVVSKVAFGETFGFLDKDEDPFGYVANLEEFLPAIIVFGVYTELTAIMRMKWLRPYLPKSSDKRGLGRVMGYAEERVAERFSEEGKVERRDMLGSFIRHGLGREELESETLTQITAGSDSTASALRMTLHYISTCPPVLERLLAEARAAVADGRISRPVVKDAEARRLLYLQCCIKEGLRIYPPVTGLLAKAVPKGGCEIDGKFVPEGTQIAWNSWGMMRDEEIFGRDSEVFRPERWMATSEVEERRVEKMNETVDMVFGYGRFGCLGRNVAMMELNKAIEETLLKFNLQPVSIAEPFKEMAVGFYIHKDMNFVITKRREE